MRASAWAMAVAVTTTSALHHTIQSSVRRHRSFVRPRLVVGSSSPTGMAMSGIGGVGGCGGGGDSGSHTRGGEGGGGASHGGDGDSGVDEAGDLRAT